MSLLPASSNAPLAAVLKLSTDTPSRVSVSASNREETWTRDFYDYSTTHSVPLLGFKPDTTNEIAVTVHDQAGNSAATSAPLVFITGRPPADLPKINLLKSEPDQMEPGFTLFRAQNFNGGRAYICIVNASGDMVWYSASPTTADVRQLENGDLFIPLTTNFYELDLQGDVVKTWPTPTGYDIDVHDGVPTDHGTILYLSDASREVTNFPTSATDPNAPTQTTNVEYTRVVEISATNAGLLNVWSPIDWLDPRRIDYLSLQFHNSLGYDVEHGNAVIEDPRDDSIIVSMRHQDAVIKFSRGGQLKWILGPHENWGPAWQKYLLTPSGMPFEWQYGQHAPELTPQGTLLLYDDGNYRASPFDAPVADSNNYSRAVEYNIDEQTMHVSQVWDYGRTNEERIYTGALGDADWLPERQSVLITFGNSTYINGVHPSPYARFAMSPVIKEVTYGPNPKVVFEISIFDPANTNANYMGAWVYRSDRIPDLYPVVTAFRGIADLITASGSLKPSASQTLISYLSGAVKALGVHDAAGASDQLRIFQQQIQTAQLEPDRTLQFVLQAQSIMDALSAGKTEYASERFTGQFPHFTPAHGVAGLIKAVADLDSRSHPVLISSLAAALGYIGMNDPESAANRLSTFQEFAQAAGLSPRLLTQLHFQTERIINALVEGQKSPPTYVKVVMKDGTPRLEFSGIENSTYTVEASTDTKQWEKIGTANSLGNGDFEFEDTQANEFPIRYYRVVSP